MNQSDESDKYAERGYTATTVVLRRNGRTQMDEDQQRVGKHLYKFMWESHMKECAQTMLERQQKE